MSLLNGMNLMFKLMILFDSNLIPFLKLLMFDKWDVVLNIKGFGKL